MTNLKIDVRSGKVARITCGTDVTEYTTMRSLVHNLKEYSDDRRAISLCLETLDRCIEELAQGLEKNKMYPNGVSITNGKGYNVTAPWLNYSAYCGNSKTAVAALLLSASIKEVPGDGMNAQVRSIGKAYEKTLASFML